MSRTILLDAGPLGLITNPNRSPQSLACTQWLQELIAAGVEVIVPEISDYEVRRELLRAQKLNGLKRLDELAGVLLPAVPQVGSCHPSAPADDSGRLPDKLSSHA